MSKTFRKDLFDVWKNVYNGAEDKKKRSNLSRKKKNRSKSNSVVNGVQQKSENSADENVERLQNSEALTKTYEVDLTVEDQPDMTMEVDQPTENVTKDVKMSEASAIIENRLSNGAAVEDEEDDDDLLVEIPDPKEKRLKPPPPPKKKVTPIKIISCKKPGCKEKFTSILALNSHLSHHVEKVAPKPQTPLIVEDSDDDDDELFIDDDVELVLEENIISYDISSHAPLAIESATIKKEKDQVLDRKLVCDICGEAFGRTSGLLAHKKISHNSDSNANIKTQTRHVPRQNGIHESSRDKNSIYSFKRYDTNRVDFICRICSNSYGHRSHLDRHVQTFHVTKIYVCVICNSGIVNSIDIDRHLNTFHSHLKIDEISSRIKLHYYCYSCPLCIYRSKDRQLVTDHMISEHYDEFEKDEELGSNTSSSPDPFEHLLDPESVDKVEMRLEELKAEKIIAMSLNSKPNGTCKHRCGKCKIVFETRDEIRSHKCFNRKNVEIQQSIPILPCEPNSFQSTPKFLQILNQATISRLPRKIFAQRVNGFHICKCNKVFTNKQLFDEHHKLEHLVE